MVVFLNYLNVKTRLVCADGAPGFFENKYMKNEENFVPKSLDSCASFEAALDQLINEIISDARATAKWTGHPVFREDVLQALKAIPRHEFVSPYNQVNAYANRPLPIGYGQTISQPYIVALMTAVLELKSRSKVLEVGTGCGYQTAVLAELAKNVFTIEVVSDLADRAQKLLNQLGYKKIKFRHGNGRNGWLEHAPFQAILVTAASENIPSTLVDQLDLDGRMVVPIGLKGGDQTLFLLKKNKTGKVTEKKLLPVSFVPLIS